MKRGVRFGRPAKLDTEKTALAARLIAEGRSVKEVAKTFGVLKATLYRASANTFVSGRGPWRRRDAGTARGGRFRLRRPAAAQAFTDDRSNHLGSRGSVTYLMSALPVRPERIASVCRASFRRIRWKWVGCEVAETEGHDPTPPDAPGIDAVSESPSLASASRETR